MIAYAGRSLNPAERNYSVTEREGFSVVEGIKHFQSYRKIQKKSPSMHKPPKPVTQETLRQIAPTKISPPWACTWKIALKYKVKQSNNGKFTSNYKASPIDFETQISLRR